MHGVLLCGALNDGLGPVEQMRHVPTLPVGNVPLIRYAVGLLRHAGVDDLTVNLYHQAAGVVREVESLDEPDLQTRLSFEHHLAGSASVLRRLPTRPNGPFLVMMGDAYFADLDVEALVRAHREAGAVATVLAVQRGSAHPAYGRLVVDQRDRLAGIEKERADDPDDAVVNTGLYLFEPAAIEFVTPEQHCQIGRDLLPALAAAGKTVLVRTVSTYYQRVNSFRQFWTLNRDVAAGNATPRYRLPGESPRQLGTEAGARVRVDLGAKIEGPVLLGDGVKLERDAVVVGPSVLGRGVTVRRGARLREVVVLPQTEIGLAARFEGSVLFGEHCVPVETERVERVADPRVLRSTERRPVVDRLEGLFHSAVAAAALIVLAPLLLLVALAIRLDSPGPVFYTQLRVGSRRRHAAGGPYPGRVFELFKFRSMHLDAEARLAELMSQNSYRGAFVKFDHDPRITRVGRLLRKTSLDELPQLINIVRGDMRLVGNRPLPLYEAEQMRESWQQVRFGAPAGLTGLWQVSGRSDLSMEERIILDNYYAVTRNFWTDMSILLKTVPAVLLQHGSR